MNFIFEWLVTNNHYMSFIGIAAILAFAYACSSQKKAVSPLFILKALGLQFLLAVIILKTAFGQKLFADIAHGVESLYQFADSGCRFVFGNLADASGPWAFVFAFKVLPIMIFFGALMGLLSHLGLVAMVVRFLAQAVRPIMGTSGAETLSVVGNSFLGQTEAPLLIKHYLAKMTDSEMMTVMVSGMAHLSGAILAVYGLMGVPVMHLLSASIMAIPGAILISKILIPETEKPETAGDRKVTIKRTSSNVLDAISTGTSDGLALALNVAAMLIAFISLMTLADALIFNASDLVLGYFGLEGFHLNDIFAKLFYGVAYLLSIPMAECQTAGVLLGQKLVVNEFVAYSTMVKSALSDRSVAILTYALAGFSNFSCIGIQIGGIGALCAEKRQTLTRLGARALLGGTLANLLNAAIASLFV
jgi:concentrative nucleoside transporter, CNT family